MKKAALVINEKALLNNNIFNIDDKKTNRDDCLYPFFLLKKKLGEEGYNLSTSDINNINESEIVIYNEMPRVLPLVQDYDKSYLILFESQLIRKDNWDLSRHKYFKKIFTWNDSFIDNVKYFKINFSFKKPKEIERVSFEDRKLCCLISGNKKVNHPQELYSKRVEVIRWFEKNHINEFDLYGMGWDKYRFTGPKLIRALNKLKFLTNLLSDKYPSFRGSVESKKSVLKNYKFSICYENAENITGYITEKIFDCFLAGTIPVYRGASNIEEHIPNNCYIHSKDFESYEELIHYLKSMKKSEFESILDNISKFILSDLSYMFTSEYFSEKIIEEIISEISI